MKGLEVKFPLLSLTFKIQVWSEGHAWWAPHGNFRRATCPTSTDLHGSYILYHSWFYQQGNLFGLSFLSLLLSFLSFINHSFLLCMQFHFLFKSYMLIYNSYFYLLPDMIVRTKITNYYITNFHYYKKKSI